MCPKPDTWTLKSGFPIVTLRRAGSNVVFISQEPFVPLDQRVVKQDPAELWYVPIAYASKQNPDFTSTTGVKPKFWLDKDTLATSKVLEASTNEWIILNPDARSNYTIKGFYLYMFIVFLGKFRFLPGSVRHPFFQSYSWTAYRKSYRNQFVQQESNH